MKMSEIRKIAKGMNITGIGKMNKTALIHSIQSAEGNSQCFATNPGSCGQSQCLWLEDCLKAAQR